MRAPLAGSFQKDKGGLQVYSATIPDFITDGIYQNAEEREYLMNQFEEFGNDRDVVMEWTDQVQELMDSVDTTMNFMTAKLASTGKLDYTGIGRGIQAPIHKTNMPADNFKKCGKVAWADETCDILEQMRVLEESWRKTFNRKGQPLVWQMTVNTFFNVFLKNIQGLSPIELVEEEETTILFDGTQKTEQAWSDNIVVLRPRGNAFEFEHKEIKDKKMFEKWGNKLVDKVFATTNDGLGLLANTTIANGDYLEWHTDLMFAAVPAMLDFPYRWIIDITQKG